MFQTLCFVKVRNEFILALKQKEQLPFQIIKSLVGKYIIRKMSFFKDLELQCFLNCENH